MCETCNHTIVRRLIYPAIVVFVASCTARNADGCSKSDITMAREAGRRDAMTAVESSPGSYARDSSIIEIRIRHDRLRRQGYPSAAEAYSQSAESVLVNHRII